MDSANTGKLAALILVASYGLPSFACTDDESLLGRQTVALLPNIPLAVLVHQNGTDLALEVTRAGNTTFYNHPNDRSGFEIVLLEASIASQEVQVCIHSAFRHLDQSAAYRIEILTDFDGYTAADIANLRLFTEAGRYWAQPDVSSRKAALDIYSSIAHSGANMLDLNAWGSLASARGHIYLSNFPEAIQILQSHDFATSVHDEQLAPLAFYYLGLAQLRSNEAEDAIGNLQKALQGSLNDLASAELTNYLGEAELILGRFEGGRIHIEAALAQSRGDHSLLAHIHNNMGFIQLREAYAGSRTAQEIAQFLQDSIAEHQLARTYAISAGDSAELILIENNLGTLYERTGELRKANQHYREALRLTEATRDQLGMSVIYRHLGIVSQHLGDYTKAESYLQFAAQMANSESASQRTRCLLGKNHILTGQFDRAVEVLQQCYQFAVNQQDISLEIRTLTEFAEVSYLSGIQNVSLTPDTGERTDQYFTDAWSAIRQARALINTLTDLSIPVPDALASNICLTEDRGVSTAAAAPTGSVRTEEVAKLVVGVLTQYAIHAQRNGLPREALANLVQARSQLELNRFLEEIEILAAAMQVYRDQDRHTYSVQCGNRAIELIESLHQELAAEQNGAAWSARTHDIYVAMIEMLLQQVTAEGRLNPGIAQAALELAERSRAINLRQQLAMPGTDVASFEMQKLQENISRIAGDSASDGHALINNFMPASFYHQRDLLEMARITNISSVPVPAALSLAEIQNRIQPNQSALYYLITEKQSYLFEVAATTLKLHTLGKTSVLRELMNSVTPSLKSPGSFPFDGLGKLSEFLLPSSLELTGVSELIIVPHRGLDALPFATLHLSGVDNPEPLVARYTLKTVPSLSAYFMQKPYMQKADMQKSTTRNSELNAERPADVAIFANPVFSSTASVALASSDLRSWSENLQPLPFTEIEASRLTEVMENGRILQFIGNRATLRNLTSAEVRSARILHIATHGYFQSTSSDNVGLAFSAVDESGKQVANFVTLSELLGHSFSNDLVVISGCDTAMGLQLVGEGMMGLTRGFISQGVKHVISTLWPVSDRASAEFMSRFYVHLLQTSDVAVALQQAQLDLTNNPNYRNPYYWAGYVLTTVTPDSSIHLPK